MKKVLSIFMAVVMLLICFAGCAKDDSAHDKLWDYINSTGTDYEEDKAIIKNYEDGLVVMCARKNGNIEVLYYFEHSDFADGYSTLLLEDGKNIVEIGMGFDALGEFYTIRGKIDRATFDKNNMEISDFETDLTATDEANTRSMLANSTGCALGYLEIEMENISLEMTDIGFEKFTLK